jgi:hypothetical protein
MSRLGDYNQPVFRSMRISDCQSVLYPYHGEAVTEFPSGDLLAVYPYHEDICVEIPIIDFKDFAAECSNS